ncbi:MAG TPA: helix-turn-helix transcriptional regulator [Pirellulales bacterium]|nr:helix-turn-helix transcriptional regulator [Pirellulales bacterium]
MTKTLVEEYVSDPLNMRLFQQERAIFEVTQKLEEAMKKLGVSRAELAARLGKTKGWISQMLDGEANKTVRTVADAFAVLGLAYHSSYGPIQVSNASTTTGVPPARIEAVSGSTPTVRVDTKLQRLASTSVNRVESIQFRTAG